MTSLTSISVHAAWDNEASVWVAISEDVEGLAVEAATLEALEPKVKAALSDLIELNGIRPTSMRHDIGLLADV